MNRNIPLGELMNNFQYSLFSNFSDQEFKLPNGIARLIHADDEGNCWLLFHTNIQDAGLFEKSFPAQIRLYEKGKDYYIEGNGLATILTESEEWMACPTISFGMSKALRYHGLVVHLKMSKVTVTNTRKYSGWAALTHWMEEVTDWMLGDARRKQPAMEAQFVSS